MIMKTTNTTKSILVTLEGVGALQELHQCCGKLMAKTALLKKMSEPNY